jgi:DNA-binding NtrC family response regulator
MNTIKILLLDNKKNLKLRKQINRLLSGIQFIIDFETRLHDFANNNLKSYDIAIISNDIINKNKDTLFGLLKIFSKTNPKTQILLLVEEQNIALAAKTLRAGTFQYLKLPGSDEELKLLLEAALHQQPQIVDIATIEETKIKKFGDIIGGSTPMLRIYNQISQAAQTDIPVLILGETGTGKDLVAHSIHKISQRSEMPYIAVNLGAVPLELVGSELYGHEKGAFTGALQQHKGVFEQGNKGTVFLDEIDTMDEKVQVTLLRLLEQKKFKRLGGTRSLHSEARLIAATNDNLDNLVESGIFRPDLFYRLDVFRITIPALRERKSDIPLIVDEMVLKYAKTYKKNLKTISQSALDALINFEWPGNVRELKNAVQRAVLVCNEEKLQLEHLPPRFHKRAEDRPSLSFALGTTLEEVEREMVSRALAATNNNRKEAAKLLGISRRAIYNKLEKHNL